MCVVQALFYCYIASLDPYMGWFYVFAPFILQLFPTCRRKPWTLKVRILAICWHHTTAHNCFILFICTGFERVRICDFRIFISPIYVYGELREILYLYISLFIHNHFPWDEHTDRNTLLNPFIACIARVIHFRRALAVCMRSRCAQYIHIWLHLCINVRLLLHSLTPFR